MRKRICISAIAVLFIASAGCLGGCTAKDVSISTEESEYTTEDSLVEKRNSGVPEFDQNMLAQQQDYVEYGELDEYGRATGMTAVLSEKSLRKKSEKTDPEITTTGYHKVWYDTIVTKTGDVGANLWQHCHLLKSRLGGASDDERNFFTGTYSLNVKGMAPYEDEIIRYLELAESENHVLYRVTPVYEEDNLVASGVIMEALSMEDGGEGLCFHVYVRNIQHGIHIDYKTGFSYQEKM